MSDLGSLLESARMQRRPLIMGVLNVTPDSFSDGSLDPAACRARVDSLLEEGAEIIDIGGESTRPRARPVPAKEQLARVLPAIIHARERRAVISVDTTLPEVAGAAIAEGATVVNDVSCLADLELARVAERGGAWLVIMHSRGAMESMPGFSVCPDDAYADVAEDTARELAAARERAERAGVVAGKILLDPGLGFHKNARHSYELIRNLHTILELGSPVVVGPSRKSFLARDVASQPGDRLGGTVAACLACADRGAAVLRVHDVRAVRQALAVHRALADGGAAHGAEV